METKVKGVTNQKFGILFQFIRIIENLTAVKEFMKNWNGSFGTCTVYRNKNY